MAKACDESLKVLAGFGVTRSLDAGHSKSCRDCASFGGYFVTMSEGWILYRDIQWKLLQVNVTQILLLNQFYSDYE